MKIDIDKLSEAELIALNHRIVERLRFFAQARAHGQMLEFRIGDRACFEAQGRSVIFGTLTRYNRKSVTVMSETGERWNVAPQLLRRVVDAEGEVVPDARARKGRKA